MEIQDSLPKFLRVGDIIINLDQATSINLRNSKGGVTVWSVGDDFKNNPPSEFNGTEALKLRKFFGGRFDIPVIAAKKEAP